MKQPLIILILKVPEEKSSVSSPTYLIPKLCNMTELSNEERANFNLMMSLDEYTSQDHIK